MRASCFLIFDRRGLLCSRKTLKALSNGQYAVRLNIEVPDEVFKPDVRTVEIAIESPQVIQPVVTITPLSGLTHENTTP